MEYPKPVISIWMFLPKSWEIPIDAASDMINASSNQVM
jgi:hypothetical protein